MQNKIIEKLKNYNNIAILGFGREGKSTYNFIRKYDKDLFLTILDEKEIELDDNNTKYKHYTNEDDVLEFDLIIKTPGIVITDYSEESKSKITSQMELLLEFNRENVIGITGTKGKSTTTSLIYNILKDQLDKVVLVGNIGIPVFDRIDEFDDAIVVAEMSSHQLETVHYSPHIGIILNLYLDHLDHTGGIEAYHKAKMNIIKYQDSCDYAIYDLDNKYLQEQDFSKIKSNILTVSFNDKASIYISDEDIYLDNKPLIKKSDIVTKLQGEHNLKNIMFALIVSSIFKLDINKTLSTIAAFEPLEHRMEYVGKFNDIVFYNDVIATIPEATINAIKTLGNVDTLIFGGLDRGIDYNEFINYLNNSDINHFICMPSTGHSISKSLDNNRVIIVNTLEEAVDMAYKVTEKDKICLLSPAAASYEYFKNFEEKGKKYKELVKMRSNSK